MHFPLAVALTQAKITESIPREVHLCGFISICTDTGVHWCSPYSFLLGGSAAAEQEALSKVTPTAPPLTPMDQWQCHEWTWSCQHCVATSAVVPRCLWTQNRGTAQAVKVCHRISRGSCQECSLPVHQKRVKEDQVKMRYLFPKRSHGFFSTWSNFTVEDTWCPPLPETSTPTQTRFSTFLLIVHGILKSAVCLWWCKMLRSHYNKAWGDYFLISIITQSVIISRTNLISKRVLRSLMMIFLKWCVLSSLMVIFLKWCVGLKSCVWSGCSSEGDKSSTSISWGLSFLTKGNCALRTDDMGDRSPICCLIWNTLFISGE